MSATLIPLEFPLHGARLIEASAGTGKTWTIAALYVRLVLGHGGAQGFARPLQPAEILVMTFTRAATRELSDRIRQRLVEAAKCFRGAMPADHDSFLRDLIDSYEEGPARQQAAHRLALAAEAMDDAAVFTIDAWCQRMLREHAFDSGSLFDEELVEDERGLLAHAVRDYWRHHVYALNDTDFAELNAEWKHLGDFETAIRGLVSRASLIEGVAPDDVLCDALARARADMQRQAAALKPACLEWLPVLEAYFTENRAKISGQYYHKEKVPAFFAALRTWCGDAAAILPGSAFDAYAERMNAATIAEKANGGAVLEPPAEFARVAELAGRLAALPKMRHFLLPHAAIAIAHNLRRQKERARQFGFADMLTRLKDALEGANGAALRERIVRQYPVALIDEFQDTSPDQYRIFDLLYRVQNAGADCGLFLIGDPKQAIYGFRGADIHSYLAARRATAGRHYRLGINYRSTEAVVEAVNHLFLHAEGRDLVSGHERGAFAFRRGADNALPFDPVRASGRREMLADARGALPAMTVCCAGDEALTGGASRSLFADLCAERIVALLNDEDVAFRHAGDDPARLRPADIAVLVRDRFEAAAIQSALRRRKVPSVFLSDQDSVFKGAEAADVLRWLQAAANPLDGALARAAYATRTAGLPLERLTEFATDDLAWDACVEQLKSLRQVWQRQGVLAMLRRFIHELGLPASLLRVPGGERSLTNLLHLAELLQAESQKLDGEQALIRWLAEQIASETDGGEERTLRLESDAELVKVVTIHKSKGLEYPLVFLPFAASARPFVAGKRTHVEYTAEDGGRRIDFTLSSAAVAAAEEARLGEDLRLLYVALTRARHGLWLGVAAVNDQIHLSALGYLLAGGAPVPAATLLGALRAMGAGCAQLRIDSAAPPESLTVLSRQDTLPPLADAPEYTARFERDWTVASYSSLTRDLGAVRLPVTPAEEKLLDHDERADVPVLPGAGEGGKPQDAPWHRFPRGSLPGQFLHGQLEWMAREGFDAIESPGFAERLDARCERAGWQDQRRQDAVLWLQEAARTPLPPLGARLCDVRGAQPEMEFWVPADSMHTSRLDALCGEHLLGVEAARMRAPLSARQVKGMLRGFKDLVFEHAGRFWVLDYKSNALGIDDAAYHPAALDAAMAVHRYDVQGAIYLLALHRLLRSRLGAEYDPADHLGGALFFFLRGIGNAATRGCHHLLPDAALLDALDALLPDPGATLEVFP
jgi:exodeoxyribonuclease V beta subunit